ncbi:MAG: pentapeptide repeat-containing protein [Bacteroidales bacterium]|nr:pentapeptide repeat-containing protein [Bacteroidales bacterium]
MKQLRYAVSVVLIANICLSCTGTEKGEIKASEIVRLLKKGKPVQMADKIIIGDLDFTQDGVPVIFSVAALQREVQSNIFFINCIFTGRVTSNRAGGKDKLPVHTCFRNNVIFVSCDFRDEVDFDDAAVFGTVNFSQSVFRENASFNHLAVWAKDSYFSEIAAEKDFSVVYAAFAGNLYCINAKFDGNVSFQETSVKGKLMFDHNTVEGRADFSMMEIDGNAFFHHTQFRKHADFSSSRFLSAADFVQTTFSEKNFENTFFLLKENFMP